MAIYVHPCKTNINKFIVFKVAGVSVLCDRFVLTDFVDDFGFSWNSSVERRVESIKRSSLKWNF